MTTYDKNPIYNLKVIVRETGIKPDTLRAWERRYGLPEPQRTDGGHRLYSEYDIQIILWLIERQKEGLSISRAVTLWRSLQSDGQEPLATASVPMQQPEPSGVSQATTDLRDAWVKACLNFDEAAAERILIQAFSLYPPELVCLEVLRSGLSTIGTDWYEGRASVQQEHFASALALRRLHILLAAAPPATRPGRVLVACAPEEDHSFAPLLISLMLRYRGWEVLNLGSNVPIARLEETITETQPNLVILTAQLLITAATLMNVAHLLQHREELRVAYGGRIFALVPAIREKIPAHYLGDTFELAVQTAVTLMSQNPNEVEAVSVGVDYQQAYNQFRRNHSAIEARIWQSPEIERMSQEQITVSNTFMAQDILAALQLGDISLLGNEISWLEQYLEYANIDAGALHVYLQVYYQAAVEALGDNGHHVLTWLQQLLEPA